MQNKITYSSTISMLDHETFTANERATAHRDGLFMLDPSRTSADLYFEGRCGGEMRIEVRANVVQNATNGNITVSGNAKLYEGTSESTGDLDGQKSFNQVIAANTTGTIAFRVNNTDEGDDYADISLRFTNQKLSDSDCTTNIKAKAQTLGSAFTGPAVSNINAPLTVNGGKKVDFQNCDIYCSAATGTHEVHGDIRAKYDAKGGPTSDLALPVTDETVTPDTIGRYNHFSGNGSIYWTPNTGPMEVRGGIRGSWASQGWERSRYGYPTSDELNINQSPWQWYSDFQNGVIFWEGNAEKQPETASINGAGVVRVLKKLFKEKANDPKLSIDNVSIIGVSNTRYNFWRSKNRTVTFRITGEYAVSGVPDPDYTIDLQLSFDPSPTPDAKTECRVFVSMLTYHISAWNWFGIGTAQLVQGLKTSLENAFREPIELTAGQSIPAAAGLLSVKVMQDGGLTFFFRPDGFGRIVASIVQDALNRM